MKKNRWWVGLKVICENGPPGDVCGQKLTLGKKDKPEWGKYWCYNVKCPCCGSLIYFEYSK